MSDPVPPTSRSWWRRTRWPRRLAVVGMIVLAMYASCGWWLPAVGHWLDVGEPPTTTDYCLVLSGDYESRPFVAAALFRRGYVRRQIWLTLVLPESGHPLPNISANAAVTRILTTLQIPVERIAVLDGDCTTTFDEAQALARRLESEPEATVTVVTSNYHTRRSRWVFRQVLGSQADRLRFVSAPTDYYSADCWWQVEEGFSTYTKEYLKFAFYLVRYGSTGIWIAGAVVVLAGYWLCRRMPWRLGRVAKIAPLM